MRAIFTRSLRGQGPESMYEWTDGLQRLAQVCPNRSRVGHEPTECRQCNDMFAEVLLMAALEDTAPLPLLEGLIDRLEERSAAA